jgi:uncharacterized protein (UPF0332 family)
MSIHAKDFLKFAEWLYNLDTKGDEIDLRCSISRAYYGAFHTAIECLGIDNYENHQGVVREVKGIDFTLGSKLYELKKRRVEADYRLVLDDFNGEDTYWFMEECKDFISKVKKIR